MALSGTPPSMKRKSANLSAAYMRYAIMPITETVQLMASQMRGDYALSYWDSLIVAAASQSGAAFLYSEDMQHGLVVNGHLTIINPFS